MVDKIVHKRLKNLLAISKQRRQKETRDFVKQSMKDFESGVEACIDILEEEMKRAGKKID